MNHKADVSAAHYLAFKQQLLNELRKLSWSQWLEIDACSSRVSGITSCSIFISIGFAASTTFAVPRKLRKSSAMRTLFVKSALSHQPGDPQPRSSVSDAPIALSWTQCMITTLAYLLLLSNHFRTGGASNLDSYKAIEPNVYINFGPYAYPVNTYIRESNGTVTAAEDVAVWSYKFDTTSLAMRTFAEFLRVSAFPPCVLYRSACIDSKLAPDTAFSMIDALVDAVRDRIAADAADTNAVATLRRSETRRSRHSRPSSVVLKAQYEYFDRVHHYLVPQLFTAPQWRTCRAQYYSPELLSSVRRSDICSPAIRVLRPFFCNELWTTFSRSCRPDDLECVAVGRISVHLTARLRELQAMHRNATVDMLLVEGSKDLAFHRGGRVHVGKRDFDVVTIVRVRQCTGDRCTTRVIDEYRYEGESFVTDVLEWQFVVGGLRALAQLYYWVRVAALFAGCFAAVRGREAAAEVGTKGDSSIDTRDGPTASRPTRPFAQQCCAALVVFYKIPSQVVTYGSLSPMLCYLLAHAIDSPMVYELIAQKFDSFNGLLQLSATELILVSSVQMRNVWVVSTLASLVVRVTTQRSWSPLDGVWGMPQFSIALITSLTIVSQFRFIALRWTPVTHIESIDTLSPLHPLLESFLGSTYGGGGKSTPGGVFLDLKAVGCSAVALLVVGAVATLWLRRACPSSRLVFWRSHSPTPFTANVLWPASALAVSWHDDIIRFDRVERSLAAMRRASTAVTPLRELQSESAMLLLLHDTAEQTPESIDDRSEQTRATFYLMHIAMLTDPVVFLMWRSCHGTTQVERLRSRTSQCEYVVPRTLATALSSDDFTSLGVVCASDLSWQDVIASG